MNPQVKILSGIPCSGKSTYTKTCTGYKIISRDRIRLDMFGYDYKQVDKSERQVANMFNKILDIMIENKDNIIIDNTNVKETHLNEFIKKFNGSGYDIEIKFFDILLWKAKYRNVIRRLKTGKWTPINVINQMYNSFQKINRSNYKQYIEKDW